LLALHHALAYQRPGLWGDHARAPRSVVLVREGDDQLEVFGAGQAEPAVAWLAGQGRALSLVAPASWGNALGARVGPVEQAVVETWTLDPFDLTMTSIIDEPDPEPAPKQASLGSRAARNPTATVPRHLVPIRSLTASDADAFTAAAPEWALRGWGTFTALIAAGAAYGVPHGNTFAALAWIFDQSASFDSLGVFTHPRYRRLGLARAAATALIGHIARRRRKVPLWSSPSDNEASLGLARSVGFTRQVTEALIRWPPRSRPAALAGPSA
jgi:GNAT superfamily N-acetyltransferase